MKRLLLISWIFLLSISFGLTKAKADVRMPLIFGDHMVLQQDTKIAIWGWADAGENIEVAFAGQKSIKDVPHGGCVLVGCEHFVLEVVAKGTGAHGFATACLFRHAPGHFLGQAGAVILVHEFYNALDQRGKG